MPLWTHRKSAQILGNIKLRRMRLPGVSMPRNPRQGRGTMNLFTELSKPSSPLVKTALKRTCPMCGAPPGDLCTQLDNGYPLQPTGPKVHFHRVPEENL
jgi:hypothetical protein